jgi:hypothetical protein
VFVPGEAAANLEPLSPVLLGLGDDFILAVGHEDILDRIAARLGNVNEEELLR